MTASFEIDGQPFLGLNGGPMFKFSESISFMIYCKSQKEIDYCWDKLSEGSQVQQYGWLKDMFGPSWQILPTALDRMMRNGKKSDKVMAALLHMTQLDIRKLRQAYNS